MDFKPGDFAVFRKAPGDDIYCLHIDEISGTLAHGDEITWGMRVTIALSKLEPVTEEVMELAYSSEAFGTRTLRQLIEARRSGANDD